MIRFFIVCMICVVFSGCNNSNGSGGGASGGGERKSQPSQPQPGNPNANPNGPQESGGDVACIFREPKSQAYYRGTGDSVAVATEIAVAVCRQFAPPDGNCMIPTNCENRKPSDKAWKCTVTNERTGDKWTDFGRSRIEAFGFMHGICSAGIYADTVVCTSMEKSECVETE